MPPDRSPLLGGMTHDGSRDWPDKPSRGKDIEDDAEMIFVYRPADSTQSHLVV